MKHLRAWQRYEIAAILEAGYSKKEIAEYLHDIHQSSYERSRETVTAGAGYIGQRLPRSVLNIVGDVAYYLEDSGMTSG